ncbi:MAG: hypothetical protein H6Q74_2523 [Firmicutes bacterium]|nr:hypothetical protein [Bacillota bacterium]
MKKIVKKVIVYSLLVGCAQFGLNASVLEASPRCDDQEHYQRYQNHDNRDHWIQKEKARHEREMRRHKNESYRAWQDRQELEKQRHDNTINEIKAGLIGILIGSMID